jgi:hypothetical protein
MVSVSSPEGWWRASSFQYWTPAEGPTGSNPVIDALFEASTLEPGEAPQIAQDLLALAGSIRTQDGPK